MSVRSRVMATTRLVGLGLALLTASPADAIAQVVNTQQQIIQEGPPPGGQRQGGPGQGGPPRDARQPAQTGTAVIRGRVFAADSGRPLRRARIVLQAPELGGENRTTSTGADGKYEIKDLPAGRYDVLVSRSGYLRLRYGQRRPFEQGKPLQVLDRQAVENVNFTLPRMSVITGRVFDEAAEPIAGVRVLAMRSAFYEGRRRLLPVAGGPLATTDDAGQYRILGLAPGAYYVMADLRETWTVTDGGVDRVMGYAPTYYPGTPSVADAGRVTVGVGQEVSNTDLGLVPGRAGTISGIAQDSQGRPLAGRQVNLAQEYRGPGFGMVFQGGAGSPVAPDGTFTIKHVAPGDYTLQVRGAVEIGGVSVQEAASAPVVVGDSDVENVVLQTSSGWSISGQFTTDTGAPPNAPRDRFRVTPRPLSAGQAPLGQGPGGPGNPDGGRVRDDWTFLAPGVYGPATIRASVPDGWIVKTILQDGRDVTDTPFEMRSGETLSRIQIVVSNRVNGVSGQLADDKGAPLLDGSVIVFAADAEKWSEDSRFVRIARPDQEGKFQIRGLPPGDYLAVAVDYVEDGMWNDPEYLESIRRYGRKVTLGEADAQTLALKLVTP